MLGIEAIPAFIYLVLILKAPESPRWLILHRNDEERATAILSSFGEPDPEAVLTAVKNEQGRVTSSSLFNPAFRMPIFLAFAIAAFNQLSGINFIIYYAPRVFELAGLDASASLLSSAGIGIVNLVFTMLGLY